MPTMQLSPEDLALMGSDAKANGKVLTTADDLALMEADAKANGKALVRTPAPSAPAPSFVPPTDLSPMGLQRTLALNTLNQTGAPEALKDQLGTLFGGADTAESAVGDYQKTHPDKGSLADLMSRENVLKNTMRVGTGNPALNGIPGTPIWKDAQKLGNVVSRPVVSKGYNAYTVATFENDPTPRFYDSHGNPMSTLDPRVQKYLGAQPGETSARDVGEGVREGFQGAGHTLNTIGKIAASAFLPGSMGATLPGVKYTPIEQHINKTLQGIPQGVGNIAEGVPTFIAQGAETAASIPFAATGNREAQDEMIATGQGLVNSAGLRRGVDGQPSGPLYKGLVEGNWGGGFSQVGQKAEEDLPMFIATLVGGVHAIRGGAIEAGKQAVDIYEGKAKALEAEASSAASPELENQLHDQAQVYREKADKIRQRLPASARFTKKQAEPLSVPPVEAPVYAPAEPGSVAEAVNTAQEQIKASEAPTAQPETVAPVEAPALPTEAPAPPVEAPAPAPDPAPPVAPLTPDEPVVTPTSTRRDVQKAVQEHFGYTDEQTDAAMALADNFARNSGRPYDDWYREYVAGIGRGEPVSQPRPVAAPAPVEAPKSNTPAYIQEEIDRRYAEAQKLGIDKDIEDLSAQRLTSGQTAKELTAKSGMSHADTKDLVTAVKAKLGIPSMDDRTEFEDWLNKRTPPTPDPVPAAAEPAPADYQRTPFQKKEIPGPPKRVESVAEPVKAAEPIAPTAPIVEESPRDKVLKALTGEPQHVTDIMKATGLSAPETSTALALLEMGNKARRSPGNKFSALEPAPIVAAPEPVAKPKATRKRPAPPNPKVTMAESETLNQGQHADIESVLQEKYPDVDFNLSKNRDGSLSLGKIVVPKGNRGNGVGSAFMRDLIDHADKTGATIRLSPSTDFGGSSAPRLKQFYKRFGFVENAGKYKDFSTRETMYRTPAEPETLNQRQGTNRGSVEFNNQDASAIVRALKDPNASTLPHEFAHIFRRAAYRDKMLTPEEFETVEKWVGIRDAEGNRVGSWGDMEDGVAHREEKWSRGLERFLADGTAPSEALRGVFQKFVAWMKDIYAKTQPDYAGTPLDVELTPEIRKVFDKLLGGEHAPLETVGEARTREASAKASLQAMDESLKPKTEAPKVEEAEAPKKPAPTYIGSMNEGKFPPEVHDAMKKIVDENGLADKETASFPLVNQLAKSLNLSFDDLKDWKPGKFPETPDSMAEGIWRPVWQRAVTNLNMRALFDMKTAEGALKDAQEAQAEEPTAANAEAVQAAQREYDDAKATATNTTIHDDTLRNASGTGLGNYRVAPSAVDSGTGFKGLANHAEALTNIVSEGKEAEALLASAEKMSGEGPKVPNVPRPKGKPSRVRTVTAEAAAKLRDEWKAQGKVTLNQADANILHQSAPDPLEGIGVFHYEEGNKTFEPWRAAMEGFLGEKLPDNKAKYVYSQVLGLKARAGKTASAAALKTAEPLFKDHIADLGRKGNAKFLRDLPEDLRNKVLEGRPIEDFSQVERDTITDHYDANRIKPKDDPNKKSSFKSQSVVKQMIAEQSRLKNAPARSERMKALSAKRTAGPPKPIDPVVRTLRASLRGNYDAFTKELEAQHPGIVERLKAGDGTKEDYAAAGEAAVNHSPDKSTTTPTEAQVKVREALKAAREKAKPSPFPKGPTQGPPTAADAWAKKLTGPLGKEGVTKLRADMGEAFDRVADGSATPAEHARVSAAYEVIRKAKTSEPGAPALNVAPGFADALKDLRDSQKPDVVPKVKLSDIPQTEQSKFGQRVKAALKDNTDAFFDELRNDHRDIANALDRDPESLTYEQNQRLGDLFVKHSPDPVTPAKATGMVKALNDAVKEVRADKTAADYAEKKGVKDEDLTGYNLVDDGQPEPAKYGAFDTIVGRRVEGGPEAAGKIRADLLRDDVGRSAVQKLINDPSNLTKEEGRRLARAIDAEAKIGKRSDPNEVTARLTKLMRDARAGRLDLVTGKDLVRKHLSEKYTKDLTGGKLSKAEVTAKVNEMMAPVNADLDKLKDNDWHGMAEVVNKHDTQGMERFVNNLGAYYRGNLLSNTASLPAIMASHALSNAWEKAVIDPIVAQWDKMEAARTGRERVITSDYRDVKDSMKAIPEGARQAWSVLKSGENAHALNADMSIPHRQLHGEFNVGLDKVADKIKNPVAAKAVRAAGKIVNTPWRFWNRQHGAAFQIVGVPIYDNALRDAARLKATNEGLKGADLDAATKKYYENPTPEMEEAAGNNYKEKMFSNPNKWAEFVRQLDHLGPFGRLLQSTLQPFSGIPSNLAGRAIESSTPVGVIKGLSQLAHYGDKITPEQRLNAMRSIVRSIGGMTAAAAAYAWWNSMHPIDEQKHHYSPTVDMFGKRVEVGRLAPIMNAPAVGSLLRERGVKKGILSKDFLESVAGEGPYMGLISQIESIFPEVQNNEKADRTLTKAEKAGAQLLSGWLPGSAAMNAVAAQFDPSGMMRRADNAGDIIARHIPSIPGLPNKIRGHAISRTGLKIMHEQAKGKDVYGNKVQGKSVPEAGGIKLLRYTNAPPRKTP